MQTLGRLLESRGIKTDSSLPTGALVISAGGGFVPQGASVDGLSLETDVYCVVSPRKNWAVDDGNWQQSTEPRGLLAISRHGEEVSVEYSPVKPE